MARIKVLSDMLDRENPLEFTLSGSVHAGDHFMNTRRKKISLMKELTTAPMASSSEEVPQEDSFLDDVFGLGETTEICGMSQTGKSQICFQLCLNVQIPKELGGVDGEALYIDTHGDFTTDRLLEMAKALR